MANIKKATIEKANKRIWEIDFLRGVLIIGMLIDHMMFFLYFIPELYEQSLLPTWIMNIELFAKAYWQNDAKIAIRCIGVGLFFLLTGISSKFSKSNLKRSVICTGFGICLSIILTIYTLVSGNRYLALISVITCLGLSMFLYWAGKAIYTKIKGSDTNWKWWSLGIGAVLSIGGIVMQLCVSTNLSFGHIITSMFGENAPGITTADEQLTFPHAIGAIIGYYRWGNDCLGLLPYLGFTYIGGFIGEHFYSVRHSLFFRKDSEKNRQFNQTAIKRTWFINWLGSKTFVIYVVHPFIIVLILSLFFIISIGGLPF